MRTGEGTRGAGLTGRWKRRQGRDAMGGEGGAVVLQALHLWVASAILLPI
jgi:hypothetical protein